MDKGIKRIEVSDACVCCGMCTLATEFLEENEEGKAVPVEPNLLSSAEAEAFQEIVDMCSVHAIAVVEPDLGSIGTVDELIKEFQERLDALNLEIPDGKMYRFEKSEYIIPKVFCSGEYRYEYKSDERAQSAGLREFNRVMYSQSRPIVQQLLGEYKERELRKLAYYEKVEGNFYHDLNSEVSQFLQDLAVAARIVTGGELSLEEEFFQFEANPEENIMNSSVVEGGDLYKLRHLEELWFVDDILRARESLGWFETFVDTDDMEDHRGKDIYCYKNLSDLCDRFTGYLLSDTEYALNGSDGIASILKQPMERYHKEVQEKLAGKLSAFNKELEESTSIQAKLKLVKEEEPSGDMFARFLEGDIDFGDLFK